MTFEYILNERARDEFEKGAAQKQREIAKKLKELGVGAAEIIKAAGLSAEDVEKL